MPVCHVTNIPVVYHCMMVVPIAEIQSAYFWDALHLFKNQSIWPHFSSDRDED